MPNNPNKKITPDELKNLAEEFLKAKNKYDASKTALEASKGPQELEEDASSKYNECIKAHRDNKNSLQGASDEFLEALGLPKKTWSETSGRDYNKTADLADMVIRNPAEALSIVNDNEKKTLSRHAFMEKIETLIKKSEAQTAARETSGASAQNPSNQEITPKPNQNPTDAAQELNSARLDSLSNPENHAKRPHSENSRRSPMEKLNSPAQSSQATRANSTSSRQGVLSRAMTTVQGKLRVALEHLSRSRSTASQNKEVELKNQEARRPPSEDTPPSQGKR